MNALVRSLLALILLGCSREPTTHAIPPSRALSPSEAILFCADALENRDLRRLQTLFDESKTDAFRSESKETEQWIAQAVRALRRAPNVQGVTVDSFRLFYAFVDGAEPRLAKIEMERIRGAWRFTELEIQRAPEMRTGAKGTPADRLDAFIEAVEKKEWAKALAQMEPGYRACFPPEAMEEATVGKQPRLAELLRRCPAVTAAKDLSMVCLLYTVHAPHGSYESQVTWIAGDEGWLLDRNTGARKIQATPDTLLRALESLASHDWNGAASLAKDLHSASGPGLWETLGFAPRFTEYFEKLLDFRLGYRRGTKQLSASFRKIEEEWRFSKVDLAEVAADPDPAPPREELPELLRRLSNALGSRDATRIAEFLPADDARALVEKDGKMDGRLKDAFDALPPFRRVPREVSRIALEWMSKYARCTLDLVREKDAWRILRLSVK